MPREDRHFRVTDEDKKRIDAERIEILRGAYGDENPEVKAHDARLGEELAEPPPAGNVTTTSATVTVPDDSDLPTDFPRRLILVGHGLKTRAAVNAATRPQLSLLDGVGPVGAEEIITARLRFKD